MDPLTKLRRMFDDYLGPDRGLAAHGVLDEVLAASTAARERAEAALKLQRIEASAAEVTFRNTLATMVQRDSYDQRVRERDAAEARAKAAEARLEAATPAFALRALDAAERKGWESKIFALNDGLRGWKEVAAKAEERATKGEKAQEILGAVSAELAAFDRDICGTLNERVRGVTGRAKEAEAKLAAAQGALRDISEALPCDRPCESTPACEKCGSGGDYFCAGCRARAALSPSPAPAVQRDRVAIDVPPPVLLTPEALGQIGREARAWSDGFKKLAAGMEATSDAQAAANRALTLLREAERGAATMRTALESAQALLSSSHNCTCRTCRPERASALLLIKAALEPAPAQPDPERRVAEAAKALYELRWLWVRAQRYRTTPGEQWALAKATATEEAVMLLLPTLGIEEHPRTYFAVRALPPAPDGGKENG